MKNGALNFDDKKTKMKERLKLKLEYSEKIKNLENNKMLKKLNILKNNELPKIKVLNLNNNYIEEIDSYNNGSNYLINNKLRNSINSNLTKKNEGKLNRSTLSKSSAKKPKNMNLISFNENINNIYKKITINDFNNKEIKQKVFYNVVHNTHNNLESNSDDIKIEDMDYQTKNKVSCKYSDKIVGSYKNEQLLFNILNKNKEDYNMPEKQNTQIKKNKKDDERFNFLREKTNINSLEIKSKYKTNKSSDNKLIINSEKDINFDGLENDENTKNKFKYNNFMNKKIAYEEDTYYLNKDNLNLKKSYNNDNEISNKDYSSNIENKKLDEPKNKSSEDESSDVTIFSFLSEDIKDISSDFFDF